MFDDLPAPFMDGEIKIWPAHSRPGYKWFIAWQGKPFYFQTKTGAIAFAKAQQGALSPENPLD